MSDVLGWPSKNHLQMGNIWSKGTTRDVEQPMPPARDQPPPFPHIGTTTTKLLQKVSVRARINQKATEAMARFLVSSPLTWPLCPYIPRDSLCFFQPWWIMVLKQNKYPFSKRVSLRQLPPPQKKREKKSCLITAALNLPPAPFSLILVKKSGLATVLTITYKLNT